MMNHRWRHRKKTVLLIKEKTMQHPWNINNFDANFRGHQYLQCANLWWLIDDSWTHVDVPWGNIVDFDENQITVEILAEIFLIKGC